MPRTRLSGDRCDVAVVGAGIIGCAVARQLAREGRRVILVERGEPGAGASGAAAGMLAPQAESDGPGPLLELGLQSRAIYRGWIEELRRDSGIDPEYTEGGLVSVTLDARERQTLERRRDWQRAHGLAVELLDGPRLRRLFPGLAPDIDSGLLFPEDHHVEPRRLVRAAAAAAVAAGVDLRSGCDVVGLERASGQVCGVICAGGRPIRAQLTVVAAGCWAGGLGDSAGVRLPATDPVRGQMLALHPRRLPGAPVLFSRLGYLVPRRSGRLLVGSTMERVGFDSRCTVDGVARLLAAARRLVPDLGDAAIGAVWAGLRPGTEDNLPNVGFCDVPGLLLASGHLRNGILLAPITALLVADLVAGRRPRVDLTPFDPKRHQHPVLPPRR